MQIALRTKNTEALETFLQKYPESKARKDILSEIAKLRRSEYDEWTLFEVANQHFPIYLKLSTLERIGDKVAIWAKYLVDPATPIGEFDG